MMIPTKRLIAGLAAPMAAALMLAATPAGAQFSSSYKFLEAVKKQDNETVVKYVEAPGATLVNTRDITSGETALLIVTKRGDTTYMRYLLGHGARPDLAQNDGRTPLMVSVEKRFVEGVQILLGSGASVNQANQSGETPLIRAVQMQDVAMVRMLIANGADPAKRDTLAGMSAKDYAERDARIPGMLEALEKAKPAGLSKNVQGPSL